MLSVALNFETEINPLYVRNPLYLRQKSSQKRSKWGLKLMLIMKPEWEKEISLQNKTSRKRLRAYLIFVTFYTGKISGEENLHQKRVKKDNTDFET